MPDLLNIYHPSLPEPLERLAGTPPMLRLRDIGMNCGCEYTRFSRFRGIGRYSRYEHSIGVALIVWHFTGALHEAAAGLFHDVATPVFAHVIDFLQGDYLRQESTELETEAILRGSPEIAGLLEAYGLTVEAVRDYHRYPIADNDSPRLSADRLEYTLGNLINFGFASRDKAAAYYRALTVGQNEQGMPELAFRDRAAAAAFGMDALKCAAIYVSDADRYAMQRLSELIRLALDTGVLRKSDLYTTERQVIDRLTANEVTRAGWARYRAFSEMVTDEALAPEADRRIVPAKRRCIDPLVAGMGRLSHIDPAFRGALKAFLSQDQTRWICGR